MKITLTIWERIQLGIIVGSGSAPTIAAVELGLKARSVLNLSNEERAEVDWTVIGPNQVSCNWGHEYDLEFADDVWQMVQVCVQTFRAWPIDERAKPLYNKIMKGDSE